ncbi:MAG: signal peptidase II [Spirochaetaceae bacterium]|jgi:signal peptidase II|nr:signal peptidase II [Spirochaetaceae bacterium]
MNKDTIHKLIPFLLTVFVTAADQVVKTLIVKTIPLYGYGRDAIEVFGNDFLWIIHVRNKAIAFSIGHNLPEAVRPVLFIVLPIMVLGVLLWYYFKSQEFSPLQRWVVAGIIGGGMGNIIDRIFRPEGVVDFISVKFYGLFGFDRWPTFNIADASVVVCCIILLLSMFISPRIPKPEESL